MLKKLLNLIYPNTCFVCGKIIESNAYYTCKTCKKYLEYYLKDFKFNKCSGRYYDLLFSSYSYKGIIRKRLLNFKFDNQKYLYKGLSEALSTKINILIKNSNLKIDYIVYVPISFKRYKKRGYNQSYLISKEVSKATNIPILKYFILKVKNNKRQSELSYEERENNIKDVFRLIDNKTINGKNILLIDDIFTTGSTVNECARLLKEHNASLVVVATVARK